MKVVLFLFFVLFSTIQVQSQTLSGFIGNGSIKRGATAIGVLILEIPEGLHVNANRPQNRYAVPTVVRLSSRQAILGKVSYPKGKTKRFSFNEEPMRVYEGRVKFTFPVRVSSNFRGKNISVRAVVRYQACDNEVCFPPREKEITLTAEVI